MEQQLRGHVERLIAPFGLRLGQELAWTVNPRMFQNAPLIPTTVLYLHAASAPHATVLLGAKVPILPVLVSLDHVRSDLPGALQHLNCVGIAEHGVERAASAIVETLGLLPQQRRIFLSYKRCEAGIAAAQLADALAARQFDVFLDIRGVPPCGRLSGDVWHKLCDCDVLVMLHTPRYFESRWTTEEFGRALAHQMPVLSVDWPDNTPDIRTQTAARAELVA